MIETTERTLSKWRPVVVMGLCGVLFHVLATATPHYPWAAAAAISFLAAFASLCEGCRASTATAEPAADGMIVGQMG